MRGLVRNWAAACKLPFVHLGLAKDFWREFDDRYLELEKGLPSTFFVIPFKDRAGRTLGWSGARVSRCSVWRRGYCRYDSKVAGLQAAKSDCTGLTPGSTVPEGDEELEEIRRLTGVSKSACGCTGSTMTNNRP